MSLEPIMGAKKMGDTITEALFGNTRRAILGLLFSLKSWLANGWLVAHRSSRQEISDLFALIDPDLKDCQTGGLSGDWRFNIAYNAALQAATASLAAAGYRPAREAHHFRVIQSLAHTIGIDPDIIVQFDQFRKKRNVGEYERSGSICYKNI